MFEIPCHSEKAKSKVCEVGMQKRSTGRDVPFPRDLSSAATRREREKEEQVFLAIPLVAKR
jgi:hypothetical protein